MAAERQKICSPRRQPWVSVTTDKSAAERRNQNIIKPDVLPLRGSGHVPSIDPMAHAMGCRSFAAPRLVDAVFATHMQLHGVTDEQFAPSYMAYPFIPFIISACASRIPAVC
jgi:hypothetical protein